MNITLKPFEQGKHDFQNFIIGMYIKNPKSLKTALQFLLKNPSQDVNYSKMIELIQFLIKNFKQQQFNQIQQNIRLLKQFRQKQKQLNDLQQHVYDSSLYKVHFINIFQDDRDVMYKKMIEDKGLILDYNLSTIRNEIYNINFLLSNTSQKQSKYINQNFYTRIRNLSYEIKTQPDLFKDKYHRFKEGDQFVVFHTQKDPKFYIGSKITGIDVLDKTEINQYGFDLQNDVNTYKKQVDFDIYKNKQSKSIGFLTDDKVEEEWDQINKVNSFKRKYKYFVQANHSNDYGMINLRFNQNILLREQVITHRDYSLNLLTNNYQGFYNKKEDFLKHKKSFHKKNLDGSVSYQIKYVISSGIYESYSDFIKLKNYAISKYPITSQLYFILTNFTHLKGQGLKIQQYMREKNSQTNQKHPIHNVSWIQAIQFCNRLSQACGLQRCYGLKINPQDNTEEDVEKFYGLGYGTSTKIYCYIEKNGYRLPTWSEWLYAFKEGYKYQNEKKFNLKQYSFFKENSNDKISDVDIKHGNRNQEDYNKGKHSLFDMTGNIYEWCQDSYFCLSHNVYRNDFNFNQKNKDSYNYSQILSAISFLNNEMNYNYLIDDIINHVYNYNKNIKQYFNENYKVIVGGSYKTTNKNIKRTIKHMEVNDEMEVAYNIYNPLNIDYYLGDGKLYKKIDQKGSPSKPSAESFNMAEYNGRYDDVGFRVCRTLT